MNNNNSGYNRRKFIGGITAMAAFIPMVPDGADPVQEGSSFGYHVAEHGLTGDGETMNTRALQNLIDLAARNGGGILFFPPGNFITGTFELKSNVQIYLSPGCVITGSSNQKDYTRECLVYAADAENFSICGEGTINGNGESFWKEYMLGNVTFEEWKVNNWRPERMMLFEGCSNVLLNGVTIENSPAWTIHPVDCNRVKITGVTILNGIYEKDGPNTDGINPDGCSNVMIADCYLQCGDDCIVLKVTDRSETKVCRDVVVTNCTLISTETALKIGTETNGSFHNICFSNCTVYDSGGALGLIMRDGGLIDGLTVSNISVHSQKVSHGQGIFIWSHRRNESTPWGMIRNVIISDMIITCGGAIFISGAKEQFIEHITLNNIRVTLTGGRKKKSHKQPEEPFFVFGHHTAPVDIYCRYVNQLKLRNISYNWGKADDESLGSAIRCRSVNGVEIDAFWGRQSLNSDAAVISLVKVSDAFIHNCFAPAYTGLVLQIDDTTHNVTVIGNDFGHAKKLIKEPPARENEFYEVANRLPGN